MSKHRRIIEEAVAECGLVLVEIKSGGKHLKVYMRKGETIRFMAAPSSPSDHRWLRNWKCDVKRIFHPLPSNS